MRELRIAKIISQKRSKKLKELMKLTAEKCKRELLGRRTFALKTDEEKMEEVSLKCLVVKKSYHISLLTKANFSNETKNERINFE